MTNLILTPRAVAALLQGIPAALVALLFGVDDTLLSWRSAPNEWCIK